MSYPAKVVDSRIPHQISIVQYILDKVKQADFPYGSVIVNNTLTDITQVAEKFWRPVMKSVKKILRQEHGIAIEYDRLVKGYRRLYPRERASVCNRLLQQARRKATQGMDIQAYMPVEEFEGLSPAEQGVHLRTSAVAQLVIASLDPKRAESYSAMVTRNNKESQPLLTDDMFTTRRKK